MPTARPARLLAALFLPLLTPAALPADGDDPVPPPPPLVGTVVDAAGAPVAGAEVGTLSETGPAYTLTTDAAGRFAMPLGRLPDGRVEYPQVLARGPGGDLGILMSADPGHFGEPWAPGVNRDGTLTVALAPPRRVPVLVKGPDGSPVAGVTARAVVREFSADAAATDADGLAVLSVPRQALGVRVVAAEGGVGYGDAALGNVVGPSAADPGDGPDGPTAVALVPTFAQRFRLVAVGRGGETRPAAGAEVRVTLIDRTEAESGYRTSAGAHLDGVGPLIAVAGADGAVTLDWLPADLRRATFEASLPGHATVPLEVVGDSVGDERTVELPADGTLAGRVRFPDGRPAAGVRVFATGGVTGPTFVFRDRVAAVTDAAGAYAIPVAGRNLYVVSAEPPEDPGGVGGPRFATAIAGRDGSLVVLPGAVENVPDLVLAPEVKLTGRVTTAAGAPAAGVRVTLGTFEPDFPGALKESGPDGDYSRGPSLTLSTRTGPDGRYAFRVQPGDYKLNAGGAAWTNDRFVVRSDVAALTRDFTLEPDEDPFTFAGRVTDVRGEPVPGATVLLGSYSELRRGEGDASAVTDPDGRFELTAAVDPLRATLTALDPADPPPGRDRRRAKFWNADAHLPGGRYPAGRWDVVDFTLHPHVAVTGRGAGPAGQSVAGLPLELGGPELNTPLGGVGPLNAAGHAGPLGRWVFTEAWGGAENSVTFHDDRTWYSVSHGAAGRDPDGPVTDFGSHASGSDEFPFRSLEERRDAAFAAPADLPDRVPALAEVAGRMNRRCLLLVADPATDAGRELFDAVYENLAGAAAADAGFLTQVVPLARAGDVPAVAAADLGPAGLAVLNPDGAVVATERFDPVDPAAVLAFLREHASAKPFAE